MASTLRTPPRFVPTLTTVLDIPAEPASPEPPDAPAPQPDPASAVALPPAAQLTQAEIVSLEEQLLHRVLQRVDLSLEERLSDAVSVGELPSSTDIDRLSRFYLGVFQGMAIQARDGAAAGELKGMAEAAMAAWPHGA